MGVKPTKLIIFIILIWSALLLAGCGSSPTVAPTATPTTESITLPPRPSPTAIPTATPPPTATKSTGTVAVSTVAPLTPGTAQAQNTATTAAAVGATTAPSGSGTPSPTTNRTQVPTTPGRTNTVAPATATATKSAVPIGSVNPISSPSALNPSGKMAIIREGSAFVLNFPANKLESGVNLGKAVDVGWSPEGDTLVALDSQASELRILNLTNTSNLRTIKISETGERVLVSAKGGYALVASGNQIGYSGKVYNLKDGSLVNSETISIGGQGANFTAGWHPTEPLLAYSTYEAAISPNQTPPTPDMVWLDLSGSVPKSYTAKAIDKLGANLGFRFIKWGKSEMLVAKIDLKSSYQKTIKGYVRLNRDGIMQELNSANLEPDADLDTLRLIRSDIVPEEEKQSLRLSYSPNARFAAFTLYTNTAKTSQIYLVAISGADKGQVQPIGTGTVAVWQPKIDNT